MVEKIKKLGNLNTYLYLGMFVLSLISLIFVANKLYKIKNEVIETRKGIARLDNDLIRLDTIVKERSENKVVLDALNASLPSTHREVARFTHEIETIARNQAETLEVTIDKTSKNENNLNSLKFSIKTRGDYSSIKNTLSLLANLPYHTIVDSLKVDSDTGQLVTLTNFRLLMQKP